MGDPLALYGESRMLGGSGVKWIFKDGTTSSPTSERDLIKVFKKMIRCLEHDELVVLAAEINRCKIDKYRLSSLQPGERGVELVASTLVDLGAGDSVGVKSDNIAIHSGDGTTECGVKIELTDLTPFGSDNRESEDGIHTQPPPTSSLISDGSSDSRCCS